MTEKQDNLAIWDGDGFSGTDEEVIWLFEELDFLVSEMEGLQEICKREAWVHEKLAKYENKERNLAIARYYWRRVERVKKLTDIMKEKYK